MYFESHPAKSNRIVIILISDRYWIKIHNLKIYKSLSINIIINIK